MSHRPARKSKEKKAKSVEEAKEMQKRKRRTRDAWKKGAVGADECQGNFFNAIYIC